jgi:hypothetical protein
MPLNKHQRYHWGIVCPKCKDRIFSRSRHDFVSCKCGEVSIDGGLDYCKITAKSPEKVKRWRMTLEQVNPGGTWRVVKVKSK